MISNPVIDINPMYKRLQWDWVEAPKKPTNQIYTLAIQLMRQDGLLPDALLFRSNEEWNREQFVSALKSLSPQRHRKAVRRFRKAWRVALVKAGKPLSMACKLSQEDKRTLVRDFYLRKAESMVECPS